MRTVSFQEHISHLRKLLQRLKEHGVKLKPKKCSLFKREVTFLGMVVSAESYKLDPFAINLSPRLKETSPKTMRDVRKLMDFLNYYRRYIPNISTIAKPIYDILKLKNNNGEFKIIITCNSSSILNIGM